MTKWIPPGALFTAVLFVLGGVAVCRGYRVAQEEESGAGLQHFGSGREEVPNGEVRVWPVQGSIYMLVGAGANVTIQVGHDGVLLVDAGTSQTTKEVMDAIRSVSDQPLRYIIDTNGDPDHTGGNEGLAKTGHTIAGGNVVGDIGESASEGAAIIAFQTVLDRMSSINSAQAAWPTDTYTTREKNLFFNNEAIKIIHEPAAHTDADSVVFFRRSDVVSTGDIFMTTTYPVIDLQRGGSIRGEIEALNHLLYEITVPGPKEEGGTLIVPGHGRLCDQADLVVYQEMVTIIRDRIQDMIAKGMTLAEVKAARPTRDYDRRYGSTTGSWTTDMFVEAVYESLSHNKE